MSDNELTVTFTLKEVLVRIENEIREMRGVLNNRVDTLDAKIDDHNNRLTAIEHEKANRSAFRENWFSLLALMAGLAAGLGTIGLWLHG